MRYAKRAVMLLAVALVGCAKSSAPSPACASLLVPGAATLDGQQGWVAYIIYGGTDARFYPDTVGDKIGLDVRCERIKQTREVE